MCVYVATTRVLLGFVCKKNVHNGSFPALGTVNLQNRQAGSGVFAQGCGFLVNHKQVQAYAKKILQTGRVLVQTALKI
jgi:hypothetical protein